MLGDPGAIDGPGTRTGKNGIGSLFSPGELTISARTSNESPSREMATPRPAGHFA